MLALSLTLNHPAFQRAVDGFAENGRVYLAYPDERLTPLVAPAGSGWTRRGAGSSRSSSARPSRSCIAAACGSTISVPLRSRSVADGRVKLTGLDYVTNDNELQSEPIFNDGYTAPEIYRGKQARQARGYFLDWRIALYAA